MIGICSNMTDLDVFLARDVIYTSRAYATMSVSEKCIGSQCMPGTLRLRQPAKLKPSYDPQQTCPPPMEGSSLAMLATARPSCFDSSRDVAMAISKSRIIGVFRGPI